MIRRSRPLEKSVKIDLKASEHRLQSYNVLDSCFSWRSWIAFALNRGSPLRFTVASKYLGERYYNSNNMCIRGLSLEAAVENKGSRNSSAPCIYLWRSLEKVLMRRSLEKVLMLMLLMLMLMMLFSTLSRRTKLLLF